MEKVVAQPSSVGPTNNPVHSWKWAIWLSNMATHFLSSVVAGNGKAILAVCRQWALMDGG